MSHRANSNGWLRDGNIAFHGGVNAAIPASHIAHNQVARAINCTMRGGPIAPRSGWHPKALRFESADVATAYKTLKFQHAGFYASAEMPAIISSHSGRLFLTNLKTLTVQEITPLKPDSSIDRNSAVPDIGWHEQAGTYWIYQDNQSWPMIFNGGGTRRSNPAQSEIPIGNVMSYSQGRLAVALPDRHSYRVGDLLFGPSGTKPNNYRDSILKFTENNFINEGGDFQARVFGAPSNDGPITAMKSIARPDTQLGQGPLMIGTPYGVFTAHLPFDRTTWKDLTDPQQTNSPIIGPMGQESFVLINMDIWYRGMDGIRSYIMAQRQYRSWGNTPMSSELHDILSVDTIELLEHGSAVLFDNRLLMTISPAPSPHGVYHRGLAVMDFHLVSTLGTQAGPAWEGIWLGPTRILQILKGLVGMKERCFVICLNCDDEIELWELIPEAKFDGTAIPIEWSFDLPGYLCGDADRYKKLETGRIIINEITGSLSGTITYRTDANPCFHEWDSFEVCAKREDCCSTQTTETVAPFSIPAVAGTIQITVASTAGMAMDHTELTIGGYTLTLVSIDTDIAITVENNEALAVGGLVPTGTTVTYCGFACEGPYTYQPQSRLIRLVMPKEEQSEIDGHFSNHGYEFQPRASLAGYGKVREFRIFAKDTPEILGIEQRNPV